MNLVLPPFVGIGTAGGEIVALGFRCGQAVFHLPKPAPRVRQRALRLDLDHHLDHDRGHAVNRTKVLIPAVVAVAAIAAFWFLVLAPKREEITKLDADVAAQEAKADQAASQPASDARSDALTQIALRGIGAKAGRRIL